ncbi:MAG: phosphotriesterase [Acidobacteria bacterium]|nr:phosphotriesterase [Acidobacteriota bacterium]
MPYDKRTRREFLASAALLAAPEPSILVHEHVLVDFNGADKTGPGRYDPDVVFGLVKPKLEAVARLGCKRFQDCTPNFLGRDPKLLSRLSQATGIEIWTNTGLYAARNHVFLPAYAHQEGAGQLARRWVEEARQGVDGVKPRFIKIGVNRGPLPDIDKKIVRAAALAGKETGLTIASHTGNGIAAVEQLEIALKEKLSAAKFVWVHADGEKDHSFHKRMAEAGAWVEFDHVGPKPDAIEWHIECLQFMDKNKLLGRTLISQDAGYYRPGEPNGGPFKDYTHIYTDFAPRLPAAMVRTLLWENPRAAFG